MAAISPEWINLVWQQVWQCTLLALFVWLICRVVRIRRAHLAYLLWLVVLLKFVTPPIWSSSSGLFCWLQNENAKDAQQSVATQPIEALTRTEWIRQLIGDDVEQLPEAEFGSLEVTVHDAEEPSGETTAAHAKSNTLVESVETLAAVRHSARVSWLRVGLWCWAGVAACIATVMLIRFLRCWRMIRSAGAVQCPELEEMLVRLTQELGVKRQVRLMVTQSRIGPAVVGLWRPTILLPAAIAEARSPAELEPILAHELIHIRRGDLWIGLLQLLAAIVWWFHPLVWLTGRRLKFEMEQCCDEEVLAELNCDPRLYAAGLLEILELKQTLRTVPVVPGVRPLEITSKRMERIMRLGQGSQKRTPWWCWVVFVALAAVVLPGAAFVAGAAGDEKSEEVKEAVVSSEIKVKPKSVSLSPLPFYDPAKKVYEQKVQQFNETYSRDLDPLASEINMREWIIRNGNVSNYPVGDLLEQSCREVGAIRAEQHLQQNIHEKIQDQLAGLHNRHRRLAGRKSSQPAFIEVHQPPMRADRRGYWGRSLFSVRIDQDRLLFSSSDSIYHQCVAEALAELREEAKADAKQGPDSLYVLRASILSIPESQLSVYSSQRKRIKVYREEQLPELSREIKEKYQGTENSEIISQTSLVCEVLNAARTKEVERLISLSADCQLLSQPEVCFLDGQKVQIQTKQLHEAEVQGVTTRIDLPQLITGFDLQLSYSTRKGVKQRGMLECQIEKSEIGGLKLLRAKDADAETLSLPLLIKRHFKHARIMEPGKTLLLGGLRLNEQTDDPRTLLMLLKLEKGKPLKEGEVILGTGVNSDTGVIGTIQLDAPLSKTSLRTMSYPVADLVVPVPRQLLGDSANKQAPAERARFEPLIELIQQNVTPDAWEKGPTIRAFEEKLSLVIRADQATHDQIADLIARIRAVHNRAIEFTARFFFVENLRNWYEVWDKSHSEQEIALVEKLQKTDLRQGIIVNRHQVSTIKRMARKLDPNYGMNVGRSRRFFNHHTGGIHFPEMMVEGKKTECTIQLHPVIQEKDQVQISMIINPEQEKDSLSNIKIGTIPQEHSLLIDVTEQITGRKPALLPAELHGQLISGRARQSRYLLLLTPSKPDDMTKLRLSLTPPSR
ncbi:M56 family metallopeptidase [Gimesia chilikensis]|uniref:M56 family metallopeptidase n=1 Tax=Gimesia chilikensis TaxID=2605989 RepID=UPI00118C6577|nr:M56 family metallopeptidase [Gimesia chilikensis]QDT87844.1 Regulatory protein BlaR1 [Gimesia chilikensis]